jgi:hypothetical protein
VTVTHGLSRTHPLYERWKGMRARCNNPNHPSYPTYGAKGVKVCARWDDFTTFLADMGDPGAGVEIHRQDTDGDYAPDNCVWLPAPTHRALPKSAEHRAAIGRANADGRTKLTPEQYAAIGLKKRAALDPAWLREQYVARGLSIYAIADLAGCGKSSVARALIREEITR